MTETFRAISSTLHQLGLAKVDMTVNIVPVMIGALVAPMLVYLLASSEPLLGTALALLVAAAAAFTAVVPISCRALPIVWPVRRIVYAAALAVPLCLLGRAMGAGFGELSEREAMIALVISGLATVFLQYVMAKEWLRQVHPEVGGICEENRACP